jgi:hypothetical protein
MAELGIGEGSESGGEDHYMLQKYAANGDLLWTQTYAGGDAADYGIGVAVAPDHSVVTVGSTRVSGHRAIMVRKYATDGGVIWARTIMGGTGFYGSAYGTGVSVNASGRIAVVGCVEPPGGSVGIQLRKYQ